MSSAARGRRQEQPPKLRAAPFRVESDPPLPADGLCVCGCGRELPPIGRANEDPFATSECARRWYGVKA